MTEFEGQHMPATSGIQAHHEGQHLFARPSIQAHHESSSWMGSILQKIWFPRYAQKKSETTEAIAEVQEVLKQMAKSLDDSRESLFLSVWGFAGQEVFDVLHHVSLTRCGVYVHCFNLRSFEPEATDLEPEENKMKQ